ncbi:hypothetical protein SDC9_158536 [bioreactor metagenome]|uniref:Uncharacterized protein n=1 Tax=bioreactor metagenome TaxID=1076179 RepID=A0A645FA21_9ZZZZ
MLSAQRLVDLVVQQLGVFECLGAGALEPRGDGRAQQPDAMGQLMAGVVVEGVGQVLGQQISRQAQDGNGGDQ